MNGAREEGHSVGAALCSVDMSFLLYYKHIIQNFGVGKIIYIYIFFFFKKSLLLTKAAFI